MQNEWYFSIFEKNKKMSRSTCIQPSAMTSGITSIGFSYMVVSKNPLIFPFHIPYIFKILGDQKMHFLQTFHSLHQLRSSIDNLNFCFKGVDHGFGHIRCCSFDTQSLFQLLWAYRFECFGFGLEVGMSMDCIVPQPPAGPPGPNYISSHILWLSWLWQVSTLAMGLSICGGYLLRERFLLWRCIFGYSGFINKYNCQSPIP